MTGSDQGPAAPGDEPADTVAWRVLLDETAQRLADAGVASAAIESKWLVEEASGSEGADLLVTLDEPATVRGVARLDDMVARRCAGEPVQYVLGHWSFRTLDLLCDRRVLIPRPETEQVVGAALAELDQVLLARPQGHVPLVVDLGTGSGAIALSIVAEHAPSEVWAVDRSPDAVAVARANLAGLGMAGARVRIEQGSWFDPLPPERRGDVDLVVTNPPYIAAHEDLPASVAHWEPTQALVSGASGLEAYEAILAEVGGWLAPGGSFVAEVGATQASAVADLAAQAGLVDVRVLPDHAGHQRTVIARRPG